MTYRVSYVSFQWKDKYKTCCEEGHVVKCGEILASEMINDGLLPVEARLLDIASRRDRVFCCRVTFTSN